MPSQEALGQPTEFFSATFRYWLAMGQIDSIDLKLDQSSDRLVDLIDVIGEERRHTRER